MVDPKSSIHLGEFDYTVFLAPFFPYAFSFLFWHGPPSKVSFWIFLTVFFWDCSLIPLFGHSGYVTSFFFAPLSCLITDETVFLDKIISLYSFETPPFFLFPIFVAPLSFGACLHDIWFGCTSSDFNPPSICGGRFASRTLSWVSTLGCFGFCPGYPHFLPGRFCWLPYGFNCNLIVVPPRSFHL